MEQDLLKKHFIYKEGHLWWTVPPKYLKRLTNRRFGQLTQDGYIRGSFKGKRYFEHRLVWMYHYGEWPKDFIDHINRKRDDNRIENLRDVDKSTNGFNTASKSGSSSSFLGVGWHKRNKKWISRIRVKGKLHHLGYFDNEKDASFAYQEANRAWGINQVEYTE